MTNSRFLVGLLVSVALLLTSIGNTIACTALMVTDVNGKAYYGRTMELPFTLPLPSSLTYVPADTKVESATPAGLKGKTFNTKYPILGMTVPIVVGVKQPLVLDGINDQGLSFSANALLSSSAPAVGSDNGKILSINDIGAWILGSFKNVAEVKAAMESNNTEFWLPRMPILGNVPAPLHFAIFDKAGNGLVIEFFNGKKNIYDNPVGVLTNGPEFTWHLTNLNNYTQSNVDKNSGQLGKLKLQTQDSGIALTALPSAQTATGRFVKGAFLVTMYAKEKLLMRQLIY